MTGSNKKRREALGRLTQTLVEDILDTSDQEILTEFAKTHGDPAQAANSLRALFEKNVLNAKKARLRTAQASLAADRLRPSTTPKIARTENARKRLRRALANCPPEVKLTLAARNESELSDADVAGMLQDLEELGIVAPEDESGGPS